MEFRKFVNVKDLQGCSGVYILVWFHLHRYFQSGPRCQPYTMRTSNLYLIFKEESVSICAISSTVFARAVS